MVAPAETNRQPPAGTKIDDGYQTLIAFAADPDASFWEKTIKPPGLDGLDPIDTTTMHNVRWRTMAARALISMTDINTTVAYDPALYETILSILNVEGSFTVWFPDGKSLSMYGFLRAFEPADLAEGTHPEATVTIVVTNQDPNTGDEEEPVLTIPPTTTMP